MPGLYSLWIVGRNGGLLYSRVRVSSHLVYYTLHDKCPSKCTIFHPIILVPAPSLLSHPTRLPSPSSPPLPPHLKSRTLSQSHPSTSTTNSASPAAGLACAASQPSSLLLFKAAASKSCKLKALISTVFRPSPASFL